MAFYLRKSFKAGPLRLNLSKSGLGLSAGVTGARIGLGPRGAYVHGGRHGLYYRKYVRTPGRRTTASQSGLPRHHQQRDMPPMPAAPSIAYTLLLFSFILLLIVLFGGHSALLIAGLPGFGLGAGLLVNYQRAKKNAQDLLEKTRQALDAKTPMSEIIDGLNIHHQSPGFRTWLEHGLLVLMHDAFYADSQHISAAGLLAMEDKLMLSGHEIDTIKVQAFSVFLEELIGDHMISKEEESQLNGIICSLKLPEEKLLREKEIIRQLVAMREAAIEDLPLLSSTVPLRNGEVLHYETYGRLLKERIINQFQSQGIRHREIGYDTDMEGRILLSNRRILIIEGGSRSYALNRILDVSLSIEDHTVQLALDGRKSPLIFTMPDTGHFAGLLQQITEILNQPAGI